jgi:hypothetical protein
VLQLQQEVFTEKSSFVSCLKLLGSAERETQREREREREREIGDIRTLNQEVFFGGFLSDWVDPLKCTVQAHGPLVKTSFKTPSLICRPSLEIQCR